ncbi:MAG: hypothetical protein CYPHOPRED_004880 [Cyphobasidiales sp. Tagirdzhanova-0007]|nr:MAG: hypothetical protein CYPHOPRED_004880 [Cyphobasidiales sp. Tagirdzhanova-0007]
MSAFIEATMHSLAIPACQSHPPSQEIEDLQSTPKILSDLQSLFALISKETTALSLAFAPPKESWDAVEGQITKLTDLVGKIHYVLGLWRFANSPSGLQQDTESLLVKEWRLGTLYTIESLKDLIDSFHSTYMSLEPAQGINIQQRKKFLTLTSLIWKAVEKTVELPKNENEAFVKIWKGMLDTLQDAMEEVQQLIKREQKGKGRVEEQDREHFEEGSNQGDDDYFDIGESDDEGPLDEAGLEVAVAALQLMKLVRALYKRIATESSSKAGSTLATFHFVSMHRAGQALLSAQDDLASSLYSPQSRGDIAQHARDYREIAQKLVHAAKSANDSLLVKEGELEGQLSNLSLVYGQTQPHEDRPGQEVSDATKTDRNTANERIVKVMAWYEACGKQIDRAAMALLEKCEGPNR